MEPVEAAYRQEYGQVVASLIKLTGDWELAEDCAQDALASAIERWPRDGVPARPGAWLMTVARNQAIDRLRREAVGKAKQRQLRSFETPGIRPDAFGDDRLELIFTCCHPALPLEHQVALTLRTVSGLSTVEIARAFLVSEQTMSRRLVRAKQKIREAGIPFRVPAPPALQARLTSVLGVLYLVFNQGYSDRATLRREALELGRVLHRLMPAEPEVMGLLALMLLHEARSPGRRDDGGELIPLEEQDRTGWSAELIAEGLRMLDEALLLRRAGPYQVQAAIAACHATAASFEATDWGEIASLYELLAAMTPSPVVELNRAVAVAMADGPVAGLELLEPLDQALSGFYLLPATRADLLRRSSRFEEAGAAYREALELAPGEAEQRYLGRRLSEVS